MAPINFEEDIKEKLDKRTITPSKRAWGELSKRLDKNQSKKGIRTSLFWVAVAASVIGILFVGSQFVINTSKNITKSQQVVDVENETKETVLPKNTGDPIDVIVEKDNNGLLEGKLNKEKVSKEKFTEKTYDAIVTKKDVEVLKDTQVILQAKKVPELDFESQKIQEVASAINTLKNNNVEHLDENIDALLKQAQKEILIERLKDQDKVLVDATLLLEDVEYALDKSFRDKVFKKLKESYGTVKTAIAHRND